MSGQATDTCHSNTSGSNAGGSAKPRHQHTTLVPSKREPPSACCDKPSVENVDGSCEYRRRTDIIHWYPKRGSHSACLDNPPIPAAAHRGQWTAGQSSLLSKQTQYTGTPNRRSSSERRGISHRHLWQRIIGGKCCRYNGTPHRGTPSACRYKPPTPVAAHHRRQMLTGQVVLFGRQTHALVPLQEKSSACHNRSPMPMHTSMAHVFTHWCP